MSRQRIPIERGTRWGRKTLVSRLWRFRGSSWCCGKPLRVFDRSLYKSQGAADRVALIDLRKETFNNSFAGSDDAHDRLVGLHLNNFLIRVDVIAYFRSQLNDSSLGDRFSELRHNDGHLRHKKQ